MVIRVAIQTLQYYDAKVANLSINQIPCFSRIIIEAWRLFYKRERHYVNVAMLLKIMYDYRTNIVILITISLQAEPKGEAQQVKI